VIETVMFESVVSTLFGWRMTAIGTIGGRLAQRRRVADRVALRRAFGLEEDVDRVGAASRGGVA
jgi:hypothetical protein